MKSTALFDAIRLVGAIIIAYTIIVGGFYILYETRHEVVDNLQLIIAGFIGSAVTFVFGQESGARATRAAHDTNFNKNK